MRADDPAIGRLEEALGYRFENRELLAAALTHRSYASENPASDHYERLEFLGDAVLELAATRYLYENYPDASEGEMAKVRASVVSESALAVLARFMGIPDAMRLSEPGVGEGIVVPAPGARDS